MLCVDEKPSIQALERAQGYLKLPNGRALTGQSHDYRPGVARQRCFFRGARSRHRKDHRDAFKTAAPCRVPRLHGQRHLGFSGPPDSRHPRQSQHPQKNEHWLKAHPNVQFHFTPTSASWLDQVEVWVSILQGQSLSGASFTSLRQLQAHIDASNAYNETAEPFVWTKKKSPAQIQRPTYHSAMIPGTRTSHVIGYSLEPIRLTLDGGKLFWGPQYAQPHRYLGGMEI